MVLYLNKIEFLSPKDALYQVSVKFSSSGSGEEEENVKSLRRRQQRRTTTDKL